MRRVATPKAPVRVRTWLQFGPVTIVNWPIGPVRSGRRIVDAEIAGSNPAWVAKAVVVQW